MKKVVFVTVSIVLFGAISVNVQGFPAPSVQAFGNVGSRPLAVYGSVTDLPVVSVPVVRGDTASEILLDSLIQPDQSAVETFRLLNGLDDSDLIQANSKVLIPDAAALTPASQGSRPTLGAIQLVLNQQAVDAVRTDVLPEWQVDSDFFRQIADLAVATNEIEMDQVVAFSQRLSDNVNAGIIRDYESLQRIYNLSGETVGIIGAQSATGFAEEKSRRRSVAVLASFFDTVQGIINASSTNENPRIEMHVVVKDANHEEIPGLRIWACPAAWFTAELCDENTLYFGPLTPGAKRFLERSTYYFWAERPSPFPGNTIITDQMEWLVTSDNNYLELRAFDEIDE